jgi:hypothetical protein
MNERQMMWSSCGHLAHGAACTECYRILARKAHELQMEVDRLREELEKAQADRKTIR